MSLDVYLIAEADTGASEPYQVQVYEANITHNLNRMAKEAGIYEELWRPDEIGITHACELIRPLRSGANAMYLDPPRFQALNPENGWGSYDDFLPWLEKYIAACQEHPKTKVKVSR